LYSQGVVGSQNGIKALNDTWRTSDVQEMLVHARNSLEANSDLSTSASVPSYGWIERERREREAHKGNGEHIAAEDQSDTLNDEDISRITVHFRKAHPSIKLDVQDDNCSITV
jgi:hypothetical protein